MVCGLIDLTSITDKTLPLILIFTSIILTGNIIRFIYFAEKDKLREEVNLKIKDTVVITTGLIINWLTLIFMKTNFSIESFNLYIVPTTWLYIAIITIIFGLLTWNFRCKGKKFLKDATSDAISFILGIFFLIVAVVFIRNIYSFIILLSLRNLNELITNMIQILFSTGITFFFGYAGINLLKLKNRRYHKKTR